MQSVLWSIGNAIGWLVTWPLYNIVFPFLDIKKGEYNDFERLLVLAFSAVYFRILMWLIKKVL